MLVMGVMGVAVIGLTNLAVSFALALMVALRARSVSFAQERQLASSLWHRLLRRPREFFSCRRRIKVEYCYFFCRILNAG
ncbi:hypothetical protein ACFS07_25230 [Undibacterium arcticum]